MKNKYIEQLLDDIDCKSDILEGERNGFLLSLMVVSSYAIQADGTVMESEMEFVRDFLASTFGTEKKTKYEALLQKLFAESKKCSRSEWDGKVERCTREMVTYTTDEQRLLLVAYLIKIVQADGFVLAQEVEAVNNIAKWLDIEVQATNRIDELRKDLIDLWTI